MWFGHYSAYNLLVKNSETPLTWQDIAVVPFLVLLPLIENGDLMEPGQSTMSLLAALGPTALQARPNP